MKWLRGCAPRGFSLPLVVSAREESRREDRGGSVGSTAHLFCAPNIIGGRRCTAPAPPTRRRQRSAVNCIQAVFVCCRPQRSLAHDSSLSVPRAETCCRGCLTARHLLTAAPHPLSPYNCASYFSGSGAYRCHHDSGVFLRPRFIIHSLTHSECMVKQYINQGP